MPKTKPISKVLEEMGFAAVQVKPVRAKKVKNTNTVTLTKFDETKGAVTFKFGDMAMSSFATGDTEIKVDVYVNPSQHTIAFVPTTEAGAQTATVKNNKTFVVGTLGAQIPAEYLGKTTYPLTWTDGYATITLAVVEEAVAV